MNRIHPTAVVDPDVQMGDGNVVGPFVVMLAPCEIGDRNWFGPGTVVGTPAEHRSHPQHAAWAGDSGGAGIRIGDGVVLREHVTVHQGTERVTTIDDGCFIMSHGHVGHDTVLRPGVTTAAGVRLAGHCTIWDHATLGMSALVHQRTHVGPGAMVGMGAVVRRDVAPFLTVAGDPARVAGTNETALRKLGVPARATADFALVLKGERPDWPEDAGQVLRLIDAWNECGLRSW